MINQSKIENAIADTLCMSTTSHYDKIDKNIFICLYHLLIAEIKTKTPRQLYSHYDMLKDQKYNEHY